MATDGAGSRPDLWATDSPDCRALRQAASCSISYFKQLFAQVTNPPVDALREDLIIVHGYDDRARSRICSNLRPTARTNQAQELR
ncbi:MAG: glutamate synthase central domain-containing protein [Pyrinomonadaceae bacterium]